MLFATVRQRKIYVKKPVTVIQNGKNVDWLSLEMDDEWHEMDSIWGVFTSRHQVQTTEKDENGEDVIKTEDVEETTQVEIFFGEPVMVPWERLTHTGLLSLSITGYVGGEKVMTTMLPDSFWTVVQNGATEGDESIEPTPSLYDQIMAAAGRANTAAAAAEQIEDELRQAKDSGEFDGVSPTVQVESVTTGAAGSEAQVENVGTEQEVKLRFTIPRGMQGNAGRAVRTFSFDSNGNLVATYDDGTTQVIGIPQTGGTEYPYVQSVLYNDGLLGITYKDGPNSVYLAEVPIPVVTDEDREKWDNKVGFAIEELIPMPDYGALWIKYTNGTERIGYLLPDTTDIPAGAFLRLDADGMLAWENLTDVSEEGA